jgi:hypothetical protein
MHAAALARHAMLPAAVHRDTGKILSLSDALADPHAVARHTDLTAAQKIALVRARWEAGEWSDIIYGNDGHVDRSRAIRELEQQTEMGNHLMDVELRAIEIAKEEAGKSRNGSAQA